MENWTRFVIPSAASIATGTIVMLFGGALEFPAIMTVSISGVASVGAGALVLQSQTRRAYHLAILERRRRELTAEEVLRHVVVGDARRI